MIDTGDAKPTAVKKILYGPKEIPIMRDAITAFAKVGIYDRFMMAVGYSKHC